MCKMSSPSNEKFDTSTSYKQQQHLDQILETGCEWAIQR